MYILFKPGSAGLARATSIKTLALLFAVIAASCAAAATAHAQPYPRTFVSATGTDNSECNFTSPCQTFAQAIAATASGGEINCLTPGSFGAVTISISVTIDCEGVSNGGIQQLSQSDAIDIDHAPGGMIINLIGLDISGENGAGNSGVVITTPAFVNIRNCKIYGFANLGIQYSPNASSGNLSSLVVDNVFIANNPTGIVQISNGNGGTSNMTVRNSNISNNSNSGISVGVLEPGTHAGATIEQTALAFNGQGLFVYGSGAIALIGGSTVVNNGMGVETSSGGTVYSFKNNQIGGNNTDIDGTITTYPGGPLN